MITVAVITDAGGLSDSRTGRAFAGPLRELFQLLTSKRASEPFYWRFYAELQHASGDAGPALESRLRQSRAAQARLWVENDPTKFSEQLEDLRECFEAVEEALSPGTQLEARQELQSFAYSVRNAERQLRERLSAGVQEPSWRTSHDSIAAIAARL